MVVLKAITFLLINTHIYVNGLSGTGPLCVECDNVVHPRDCNRVTVCGEHESCSVELFVTTSGIKFYKVGCKANDICYHKTRSSHETEFCLECCKDEKLCNRKGCGASDFNVTTGKICYGCNQHSRPETCDQIVLCDLDQDCFISHTTIGTDTLYTSGCKSKTHCPLSHIHQGCPKCCDSMLCNDNCNITSQNTDSGNTASTQTFTTKQLKTTTETSTNTVSIATTKIQHPTTQSTPDALPSCPSGQWHSLKGSKYCLFSSFGKFTWPAAKALCRKHLMHLPIVDTDEKMHFIDSIIRNDNHDIWLDGTDIAVEGYWVWNTTGTLIEHTMWNTDQPDNYFGTHSENCIEYGPDYNYKWNDAPCDRQLNVLCEWSAVNPVQLHIPDCDTGWKTEGFTMFCSVNTRTTWFEAKTLCQKLHAHLPIADSAEKQTLIGRMAGQNEIWLDGTEEGHKGIWKWSSTGQNIRYSNWMPTQPDDYMGHLENCIEYGRNYNWQWNDAPCNDNQRVTKVLCERYVPSMVYG